MAKYKHGGICRIRLSNELRKNYGSDFKHLAMAVNWGDHLVTIGDKKLKETGGYFEKEMPDMFSLEYVAR